MSKIAKGISQVAGIAAAALAFIPGGQPFAAAASAIAAGAGAISQLTAKPPLPPSQLDEITFGANQPMPYAVGRCELKGHLVHSEAHGRDREEVPNPWRTDTIVLTGGGPVVAIDTLYANKEALAFDGTSGWETGYFDKYLRRDTQLGATPESGSLDWTSTDPGTPPTFDNWTGTRKISGMAAMQFGMLLDAEETHYRSGPPEFSAVGRWTEHYDPRLDSTVAGGSGSHRIDDETTFEYSTNGVIQALTYAYGRYQSGKLVLGGGLPITSIDLPSFIAAANYADTNTWTCHGVVFENGEDGEIWNNIKLMLQTAAAWPTNDGGTLRCLQRRAVVTVDTITADDVQGPCSVRGMTDWKDGFNTVIPEIMSEDNEWSNVPIDAVAVSALVTAQGETRQRAKQYKLVTDPDQASALAVLDIYDSVEIDPISLTVGRRFIAYDVGDAFNTNLPDLGLVGVTVVLLSKQIDLATGRVIMGVKTDTTAKHALALGETNSAPPQPALMTQSEFDLAASETIIGPLRTTVINSSYTRGLTLTATDAGSDASIVISNHTRDYSSKQFPNVSITGTTLTGLSYGTTYLLYYDDQTMIDTTPTFVSTELAEAFTSGDEPYRHYVGAVITPASGAADTGGGGSTPPGTSDVPPGTSYP